MVRIFRHYVPISLLALAALEASILVVAVYAGLFLRWIPFEHLTATVTSHLPETFTFASIIILMMYSQGLYSRPYVKDAKTTVARLAVSFLMAFFVMSLVFYAFPGVKIWRSSFLIAVAIAFVGILVVRMLFYRLSGLAALRRRILVLGAGDRAARIHALEKDLKSRRFVSCGYLPMKDKKISVPASRVVSDIPSLWEYVQRQGVQEIVVAPQDRRGTVPLQALLECKAQGIRVTDYSSFLERENGRIELEALYPSWLIFSEGFPGGWWAPIAKRVFDLAVSLAFLAFTGPLIVVTALAIRLEGPGAIFYRQERVGLHGRPFMLFKFRSMRVDAEKDDVPQWAAVADPRITRVGAIIRRTRIDEIPQVFNVLLGTMSFIGPRPERPYFVAQLCRKIPYYSERHRVKPGITGWAQIHYPYGASDEDAKEKLKYDLYYIKNYSLFLDFIILMQTAQVIFWPQGVR